jgi:hypothetical protein
VTLFRKIPHLPAAGALSDSDLLVIDTGTSTRKATLASVRGPRVVDVTYQVVGVVGVVADVTREMFHSGNTNTQIIVPAAPGVVSLATAAAAKDNQASVAWADELTLSVRLLKNGEPWITLPDIEPSGTSGLTQPTQWVSLVPGADEFAFDAGDVLKPEVVLVGSNTTASARVTATFALSMLP